VPKPIRLPTLALHHIPEDVIELPLKKRARTEVVVVKWPIIIGAVHTARYQTSIEDSVLLRYYEDGPT
jgi:hypothetical protein